MEQAISLREAAKLLGVSYQTIFQHRQRIGVQLPGGRKWLVYPSLLAELAQPRYNVTRLALQNDTGVSLCRSGNATASGGSIYARQAAKELDDLLARPTRKPRRNTTTA